jgi:hypothetical protein
MAFDPRRGLIWQVNVGGDNGIYGLDPSDGSVVRSIVDGEWTRISQRGLAYDPATDTFYIGGWNEGVIYHVAGPSWPEPGATIDACNPRDGSISGLAWNPAFQMLWMATNSREDLIWLVDPQTCRSDTVIDPPWKGRYDGAGIELDAAGNIWAVSQGTKDAYLIESGLPTFSDVPWLSVTPRRGEVRPGRSQELSIRIDTEGLRAGVHPAMVAVVTNDPKLGVALLPIDLLVTKYQRYVNVGGGALSFADGTDYSADRRFTEGSYGFVGDATVRKVEHAVAGTSYGSVYRSQREGLTEYRFTVPDGWYRVDLGFAELTAAKEFGRVMDVSLQGRLVLDNLDIAGRVGRWRAVDESFMAKASSGVLKVRFDRAFGRPPILNAIRVTWLSPTELPA